MDISLFGKQKQKKLSTTQQRKVIELFHNLFTSGFHLTEMVDFLKRSQLLADQYTDVLRKGLLAGKPFSALLADLQFSDTVVTQVSLSEIHGNLTLSLQHIQDYLAKMAQVRKKLMEVATYPLVLFGFLVLIMLGLKQYLLPQMEEGNTATLLIQHFPTVFFGLLLSVAIAVLLIRFWYKRTERMKAIPMVARLPLVGKFVQMYLTAYYAREWGNLIGQGLELTEILELMKQQDSLLFREMGEDLSQALSNGQAFHEQIRRYPFFKKELALIIEYGQAKSKLGSELALYADECWEEFFHKVNQAMQLIQPLIFLFVAFMIVLIYAAMLLPIYQNMEM